MRRVLILEDDLVLARSWADLLEDRGHEVVLAQSVREALAYLDSRPFEVLITDLFLRDSSGEPVQEGGLTMISRVRDRARPLKKIAVTGADDRYFAIKPLTLSQSLGADVTLRKPVDHAVLLMHVEDRVVSGEETAEREGLPDAPGSGHGPNTPD